MKKRNAWYRVLVRGYAYELKRRQTILFLGERYKIITIDERDHVWARRFIR
jgi:hypothetical protein